MGNSNLLFFLFLFLLACKEDPTTIGFKGTDTRFKVYYKEIDIPSSVIVTDSLATFNNPAYTADTRRLMTGSYFDPELGVVQTEAYTQFKPVDPTYKVPADAILEGAYLNLSFDHYTYGNQDTGIKSFYIHELADSIITEQAYFYNSSVAYHPTPIGTGGFPINPSAFATYYSNNRDTDGTNNRIDSLYIELDPAFANRLFQAVASTDSTTRAHYQNFKYFRREFKGFAITSSGTDNIVGFDPAYNATQNTKTRLYIYYRYPDPANPTSLLRKRIDYTLFDGVMGFSRINAQRTGTSLNDIPLHKEFSPRTAERYIQSGDPVFTKVDFTNFIKFADTIPNLIINSAELEIKPVDVTFAPPAYLGLQVLNDRNRYKKTADGIPVYYSGLIVGDNSGNLIVGTRTSNTVMSRNYNLALIKNDDGTSTYNGSLTSFFQRLYSYRKQETQFLKYGLVPTYPEAGKSVNRLVFNANSLKLKIYYTLPSTEKPQ